MRSNAPNFLPPHAASPGTPIVENIDDSPTLKSFSLAGPQLREQSQRILLHSLALRERWAHQRKRDFLQNSLHIAAYITDLPLNIPAPPDVDDEDDDPLGVTDTQWILDQLENVRRCVFGRRYSSSHTHWYSVLFALSSAYVGFIARQQSLRELTTANIRGLSLDALLALLKAAPVLATSYVGSSAFESGTAMPKPMEVTRPATVCGMDEPPDPHEDTGGSQRITSPLPPLLALRALHYDLLLTILTDEPHFATPIVDVLAPATSPRLAEIRFTLQYANPSLRGFPPRIQDKPMDALDTVLVAHPARPALRVVWALLSACARGRLCVERGV
ncbi:hypothetical protein DFH08DRAFT_1022545 [Mycena albidolilacea]|uniref:Uncharacterized protein n=1 Tax=Mycena albidolilacea TaxID=1033008 RepID=A0AAD7EKQ5_9AGAR|nr:hypothetical protein DFH08DRAFT_1022545 [Mycena albidolilacea]